MVLKVPRLNFSPLSLCDRPFSLLGFGDILVPGNEPGSLSSGGELKVLQARYGFFSYWFYIWCNS